MYAQIRGRPETGTASRALEALLEQLRDSRDKIPADAPPYDPPLIQRWFIEDAWELSWESDRARAGLLRADQFYGQEPLEALAEELARTKQLMDHAYYAAREPDATAQDVQRYTALSAQWSKLLDQFRKERATAQDIANDVLAAGQWQQEANELEQQLLHQYGHKGVQYQILCQTLAPLVVKLRRSYAGGIRISTQEQLDLFRAVRDQIAQLQKHTEVTRTEGTQTTQVIQLVLGIVERHIASTQPRVWGEIIEEVKGGISELQLAPPGGLIDDEARS